MLLTLLTIMLTIMLTLTKPFRRSRNLHHLNSFTITIRAQTQAYAGLRSNEPSSRQTALAKNMSGGAKMEILTAQILMV